VKLKASDHGRHSTPQIERKGTGWLDPKQEAPAGTKRLMLAGAGKGWQGQSLEYAASCPRVRPTPSSITARGTIISFISSMLQTATKQDQSESMENEAASWHIAQVRRKATGDHFQLRLPVS